MADKLASVQDYAAALCECLTGHSNDSENKWLRLLIEEDRAAIAQQAREEPVALLRSLVDAFEPDGTCGDPDAECPIQDVGKPYHIHAIAKQWIALAAFEEERVSKPESAEKYVESAHEAVSKWVENEWLEGESSMWGDGETVMARLLGDFLEKDRAAIAQQAREEERAKARKLAEAAWDERALRCMGCLLNTADEIETKRVVVDALMAEHYGVRKVGE